MPAKGDGITKRKDGLCMARYTVHTTDGPKRKTIYGRKDGDVERKLAETRGDAARGIVFDAKGTAVGELLTRWLGAYKSINHPKGLCHPTDSDQFVAPYCRPN